ncbi:Uncharacterised protein [Nocardia africana]|uniref:Uncharacterized protein n=1 Tax=Nocardia africana TaxID=134964 RepID=A0A378WJH5_9NOCA|nr:Uncharacterised protein [Nocardia africana]
MADDVESRALVGLDDGQFDDRLALGDLDADPARRALPGLLQRAAAHLGSGVAHMQRDTGRLGLDGDAGIVVGDGRQGVAHLGQQLLGVVVDGVHEADIELRAVASDQLHLDGKPGKRREISQRAAGDDGRGRGRQAGERTQCADRFPMGVGLCRIGDYGRDCPVVVRSDQ